MQSFEDGSIAGVRLVRLCMHRDSRGVFTELFRHVWPAGIEPVQWNVVHSEAGVLRGVHVHPRHADYLCVVSGRMVLALHDIRRGSATERRSEILSFDGDDLAAIQIPPGVAHGFYYPVTSVHVYATSCYWNVADELGCRWDCPELDLAWGVEDPVLSERDENASSYADMVALYHQSRARL